MIISSSLLYLTEPEKDFLEMPLDYKLLFKIAFHIRDIVYDHKNKPEYDLWRCPAWIIPLAIY